MIYVYIIYMHAYTLPYTYIYMCSNHRERDRESFLTTRLSTRHTQMSEAIKGGWPGVGGDFERRLGLGFRASAHAPSWFRIWFRAV